ncbi:MAG: DUF4013 domain-containing protein [Chloroflexi bacterium]|nr:DUF4013 domain-containing protein [Chloroflexota bacterium]
MDIGKAFGYVFEDENWVVKVLIGALSVLLGVVVYTASWVSGTLLTMVIRVPIGVIFSVVGFMGLLFTVGYVVEVVRNVADGHTRPLPDWTKFFEGKVRKGFTLLLAGLVYNIPFILITLCAGITSLALSGGRYGDSGPVIAIQILAGCLSFLYGLLLLIILPAVVVQFAIGGTFASCFQFARILEFITTRLGDYVIALLVMIAVLIVAIIVGIITCFIGILVTGFYTLLVFGHLCGQLARLPGASGLPQPRAV